MKTYKTPNLGKFKAVKNYENKPNQFILLFEKGEILQSYDSIIVIWLNNGQTYIGQNWDYSNTTGKYRNLYLMEDKKTTEKKIINGEYKMLEK